MSSLVRHNCHHLRIKIMLCNSVDGEYFLMPEMKFVSSFHEMSVQKGITFLVICTLNFASQ